MTDKQIKKFIKVVWFLCIAHLIQASFILLELNPRSMILPCIPFIIIFCVYAIPFMLKQQRKTMITLKCQCIHCKEYQNIVVSQEELNDFNKGEKNIQFCFPNLSADERELILTQTCGTCFDGLFKTEDDEFYYEAEDIGCKCTENGVDSEWKWDDTQYLYKCSGCGDVQ